MIETLGYIGSTLMLVSFILGLSKKLSVDSLLYSGMMIVGSGFATYYALTIKAYPIVMVEGIWFIASLIAFIDDAIRQSKNLFKDNV
jgi:hypothetical protein